MKKATLALAFILLIVAFSATAADAPIAYLGLGHSFSIASSKSATATTTALGRVDMIVAAVAFDGNGKVVKVTIDNTQTGVNFDKAMAITSDLTATQKSKVELKEAYGMGKASTLKLEWYQQIANLENWMVGKSVKEIKALKVKTRDASHTAVPDVPELTSLVTITVQDYISVVEEAWNNAVAVKPGAVRLGYSQNVSIAKSKGATDKATASAQVDCIMAASLFDKSGKVVETIVDNSQMKVAFDKNGKITSDTSAELKTKKELKEGYGMSKASVLKLDWYQQMENFEAWMAGKTVSEIKALKVKTRDSSHTAVPDVPELTSQVTITVEDYIAVLAKSYENAR